MEFLTTNKRISDKTSMERMEVPRPTTLETFSLTVQDTILFLDAIIRSQDERMAAISRTRPFFQFAAFL